MTDKAPGRILIVDDEEPIRKLLERRLSKMGHSCVLAVARAQVDPELAEAFIGLIRQNLVVTE